MANSTTSSHAPRLIDSTREVLRVHHYSISTERSYIQWIKRFIYFNHKRHPKEMGVDEITAYLTHLAVDRKVSASTQNQALNALLFLYKRVLKIELPLIDSVVRAKRTKRLPVVFTRQEVKALLAQFDGTRWLIFSMMYGCGFRILECLRLRVKDIDFHYKQIFVRDAKGGKDRVTLLPDCLIESLRTHLARVKELHDRIFHWALDVFICLMLWNENILMPVENGVGNLHSHRTTYQQILVLKYDDVIIYMRKHYKK